MRRWLTRNRELVFPALVVVIFILILSNLIRYKWLTASALASNKDALAALSSAVNIIAISGGAVLAYYRFFRGRTFFSRAELKFRVTIIPTKPGVKLHAILLEVKNIGSLSIWEPTISMQVYEYGPNGTKQRFLDQWNEVRSPKDTGTTLSVIDSNETASYWTTEEIGDEVWVVFYTAFVHSSQGEVWKQVAIVKNTEVEAAERAIEE